MKWVKAARGLSGDWLAGPRLQLADPYLLWWDVTGFAGAQLPGVGGWVLPTLQEMPTAPDDELRFRTRGVPVEPATLAALAGRSGGILRYEVAAGFTTGALGGPVLNAAKLPESGASGRRSRTPRPVIGFIDYGCAFAHRRFRRQTDFGWETRVLALWDQGHQTGIRHPPDGLCALDWSFATDFPYGAETHRERVWASGGTCHLQDYIDQFAVHGSVHEEALYRHCGYEAITGRRSTHGTHVMDLATGQPHPSAPGSPHDADIVFVQLPRRLHGQEISGLLRANVYDAIRYILSCVHPGQPVVINLSYGANAGPHDGTSLLERAIDWRLQRARHKLGSEVNLVVSAGNARHRRMHASAVALDDRPARLHWHNLPDDPSDSFVEIWLPDRRDVEVRVTPPGGPASEVVVPGGAATLQAGPCAIATVVVPLESCQSSDGRMILLAVSGSRPRPATTVAPYGRWEIEIAHHEATRLPIDAWCERDDPPFGSLGQARQGYFSPTPTSRVDQDRTLNSMAHGEQVVVVGGSVGGKVAAEYSGTGPGRAVTPQFLDRRRSPHSRKRGPETLELGDESFAMPGLTAAAVYGTDQVRLRGTSMATALMTRRIVEGGYKAPQTASGPYDGPARAGAHPDDDLARPAVGSGAG